MKNPEFIRDFSKENSQEERDALAKEIRQKRAEYFGLKENKQAEKESVEKNQIEKNAEIERKEKEIQEIKNRIEEINSSLPSKIKNVIEYFQLVKKLKKHDQEKQGLEESKSVSDQEGQDLVEELDGLRLSEHMKEAKESIASFYEKQKREWESAPFDKEEVEKYFNKEYLSKLSMDEYVLLLKRFPNQMVTHVTRQGIRDHLGAVNHWAGMDKFWNGFKNILEEKTLANWITKQILESEKEDQIAEFLGLSKLSKEEAVQALESICGTQGYTGSLTDRSSVHFATEEVANEHYGAETGNEIFFAYPSLLVGNEFVYKGQLSKAGGGYHNDQWVIADKQGLPIDCGIVFIPKDVPVDIETGSKYELNESLEPIPDNSRIERITKIVNSETFKKFVSKVLNFFEGPYDVSIVDMDDVNLSLKNRELKKQFIEIINELKNEFGITDEDEQKAILEYNFLNLISRESNSETIKQAVSSRCSEKGLKFKKAEKTITSQEYWEKYFKEKGYRPSKVVYYEGQDPTKALNDWKRKNGLTKNDSVDDLVAENRINLNDDLQVSERLPQINRFKSVAMRVIDGYYS